MKSSSTLLLSRIVLSGTALFLAVFSLSENSIYGAPVSEAPLGPYPREVTAWSEADKIAQREAGEKLLVQIEEQVAAGEKDIRLPKGDYRFANADKKKAHIRFANYQDVTIDFQGSNLWFETEAYGLNLAGCRNVTVRNAHLDWDPLPYFQGTVTALRPAEGPYERFTSTFDLRLDPGYERVQTEIAAGNEERYPIWMVIVFDPETREIKEGVSRIEAKFRWSNRLPNGDYRVGFHGAQLPNVPLMESGMAVGDLVAIVPRFGNHEGVYLSNSDNTVLEDVTLYSTPHIGFVTVLGGKTTFRRCNILRRPGTNRLIGGNVDGINLNSPSEGPLIEDCRIESIGDDFVNVHSTFSRVLSQKSPTELIVSRMNVRSDNFNDPVRVEFLDRKTMKKLGTRMARGRFVPKWTVPPKGQGLADLSHRWYSGFGIYNNAYGKEVPVHVLLLDAPITIPYDAIVACDARSGAGTVIRGCNFRGSYANGIRIQAGPALIQNNHISHVATYAIRLMGYPDFWGEGPYPHDVTIENNTFEDMCMGGSRSAGGIFIADGDFKEFQHQTVPYNIIIRNNRFARPNGPSVRARGVDGLTIEGNTIDGYGTRSPRQEEDAYALTIRASKNILIRDNHILNPGAYARGELLEIPDQP